MRPVALVLACLFLPLTLLHSRAGAELAIAGIDVLFLAEMARRRSWTWLKQPWIIVALTWWGWEVVCSLPIPALGLGVSGWHDFLEAVLLLRLLTLAAAMQIWVVTTPQTRRLAWAGLALACLWIGLESWQQFLTGTNIFGDRRWPDGSLTGPFWEPRAGAPFAHLLCAALLPAIIPLLNRKLLAPRLAAIALAVLALATTILIGQRMPTMLALLALATSCLFIRALRLPALIAVILGAALLAATPVISPPTYHKLVLHFLYQMSRFAVSPYGELYTRATTMGLASPWHGYGFNGFKTLCPAPRFAAGFPALGIAPTTLALAACNIHPHNFYLQALTDAGFPGLALFAALNLTWLIALARRLWRRPDPLRVGLFAGVLTYAWPFASTDSFAILPHEGWLMYMLGLGLAAAQMKGPDPAPEQTHA
jgi:O-antigen ligase